MGKNRKCDVCTKEASFNYPDIKKARFCATHQLPNMEDVRKKRCEHKGCRVKASFNIRGQKSRFCDIHKEPGMINVKKPTCESCDTKPHFNFVDCKGGRFCATHRLPGMIDVISKKCESEGCNERPAYNIKGTSTGKFCSTHKSPEMVYVLKKRICEKCGQEASFNFPGCTLRRFCSDHKENGMISLSTSKCEKCGSTANFNFPGTQRGIRCVEHMEDGMKNVVSKTCEQCRKTPLFGLPGNSPRFCVDHKDVDMVNLKGKCCLECGITPSFNFPGSTTRLYCDAHKKDGMVHLGVLECADENCDKKQPKYNIAGEKRGKYCHIHKLTGMVDVTKVLCDDCTGDDRRESFYGLPGKKPNKCFEHRTVGMIREPRKRCIEPGCRELAIFGMRVHEHCEKHKLEDEINIIERKCTSCGLLGLLDRNEHCETCDPEAFKRIRLAKQNFVQDFLLAEEIKIDSTDKKIDGGECGLERPDFLIDCGTHMLVVEVDEDQHKSRPCECEQTRMVNVSQSIGMPTMFIRYNPDKYKVSKSNKMEATSQRIKNLLAWIKFYQEHQPKEYLQVVYLYFDQYVRGEEKVETLLKTEH